MSDALLKFSNQFDNAPAVLHALTVLRERFQQGEVDAEVVVTYITGDDTVTKLRDEADRQAIITSFLTQRFKYAVGEEAGTDALDKVVRENNRHARRWWF